jgi:Dyp-type peroxidase family
VIQQPVREAPIVSALVPPGDARRTSGSRGVDPADEPRLAVDDIQGNVLAGFNKDQQTLLFLRMPRGDDGEPSAETVEEFRAWLGRLVPFVATTAEVLAFNRLFKEVRRRRGVETGAVQATWINVALGFHALRALTADVDGLRGRAGSVEAYAAATDQPDLLAVTTFADEAFKEGMAERAVGTLGDPQDATAEGNPSNWVFGGPGHEPDAVLIVASDSPAQLAAEVAWLEEALYSGRTPDGKPARCGVHVVYKQQGATLPPPLVGHEHFGFLDGVSQPGVRGRVSGRAHDVLTARQNPDNPDHGKPGQELIWPGEFVFGYPEQRAEPATDGSGQPAPGPNPEPGPIAGAPGGATAAPVWAQNGSFLVVRRLRQDVDGFHGFLEEQAATLGVTPALLGAKLVGRWASGAPISRTPAADVPALGFDDCANNHFDFQRATAATAARPGRGDCTDDRFPPAAADPSGGMCPHFAHIRKTYPRDDTGTLAAGIGDASTATHRLLRRGIPFGAPFFSAKDPARVPDAGSRGLVFAAYQTSITDQFEFVQSAWANNAEFKDASVGGDLSVGHDLIIGQTNGPPGGPVSRERRAVLHLDGAGRSEIVAERDWVIATGGGYFFAPSITALKLLTATL